MDIIPTKFLQTMIGFETLYQTGEIDRSQRNTLVATYLALDGENVQRETKIKQAANYALA
jgi:hypothetical protein